MRFTPPAAFRRSAFLVLFLSAAFAMVSLQRTVDPDIFWHLRAGQDVLRAGEAVLPDSWNYVFEGNPWVNQQWLSQILLYGAFRSGGFGGLMLLRGLVALGVTGLILALFRGRRPAVAYGSAALFLVVATQSFLFRPRIFSLLGMAFLLFLLERVSPAKRLPWVLLLFGLWSNVHAFFGLGLFVLGSYAGIRWLQRRCAWTRDTLWEWAAVPMACAASLANPFGTGVWTTAFSAFGNKETFLVTEWFPIWQHSLISSLPFLAFSLLLLVLAVSFRRAITWPSLVTAAIFCALTVRSVRFAPDFYIVAVPLLGSLLEGALAALPPKAIEKSRSLLPEMCAAMIALSALSLSWSMARPIVPPAGDSRTDYPVRAVRWMREAGLSGKIFSEYSWGGYLAWEMPESRTFIDPRTAVLLFPPGFVAAWKDAVEFKPGWRETLERGGPDFALLYRDDILGHRLLDDPGWSVLYEDDLSYLLRKKEKP